MPSVLPGERTDLHVPNGLVKPSYFFWFDWKEAFDSIHLESLFDDLARRFELPGSFIDMGSRHDEAYCAL